MEVVPRAEYTANGKGWRRISRDCLRADGPRAVVGKAEAQHDQQPENRRDDYDFGQPLAGIFHVHEEEDDKGRLESGNRQGNDRIERPEIEIRHSGSDKRQDDQRRPRSIQ